MMAIMAGDLVTRLGLDARKFQSGLKGAQATLQKFASAAKTAMVIAAGAMTAGLAIAAAGAYTLHGRIKGLADVADQAARTGMSGAFLQQLGYAADQSGISIETLTMATKNLSVEIGKGGKGIKSLGIEFSEFQRMTPDQQFLKVSEAISKLPTAAARSAAAMAVFGKAGKEMTTLFAGGLDDVNKLMKEAKALGIGLSNDALARAAKADDAIQRMYASFGALFDQLAVGVAPIFEEIATSIANWTAPLTQFMDKFSQLEQKIPWLQNVMVAGFDVAFATIEANWDSMINSVMESTRKAIEALDPWQMLKDEISANPIVKYINELDAYIKNDFQERFKFDMNALPPNMEPQLPQGARKAPLDRALDRFNELLRELPTAPPAWQGPLAANAGAKDLFGPAVADIINHLEGPFAGLKMAGEGIVFRTKMKANWWAGLIDEMFTGERKDVEAAKAGTPQVAGAMRKGSQEAYSTIVAAMMRTKDPGVKATEKQTKELLKGIDKIVPQPLMLLADFMK